MYHYASSSTLAQTAEEYGEMTNALKHIARSLAVAKNKAATKTNILMGFSLRRQPHLEEEEKEEDEEGGGELWAPFRILRCEAYAASREEQFTECHLCVITGRI